MHCSNRSIYQEGVCDVFKSKSKMKDFHQLSSGWNVVFNLIAGIFSFLCVFPFLFVMIISFTDEGSLARNGYQIWPEKWSLEAYKYVFQTGDTLLRSYGVTIFVTVVGTLISLFIISLYAYAISRKGFRYRNFFAFFAFSRCCLTGAGTDLYRCHAIARSERFHLGIDPAIGAQRLLYYDSSNVLQHQRSGCHH